MNAAVIERLTAARERRTGTPRSDMVATLQAEINYLRQQLASQSELISELEQQAMVDPLTNLPNRRSFDATLDKALADYLRYGRVGALAVIDLNGFKEVNDTLGHQAGDKLLQHVAKLLEEHTRCSDLVARVGGDEFAIILKEVDKTDLLLKLEQIAAVIETSPCRIGSRDIALSVSIGACTFAEAQDRSTLFAFADAAMYRHKHARR